MRNYWGRFDNIEIMSFPYSCCSYMICRNMFTNINELFYNFVENLCKTLRKNLRLCCEKFYEFLWIFSFYVIKLWKVYVLHRTVEKFYLNLFTLPCPYKNRFLHSFHIVYYNNYYLY